MRLPRLYGKVHATPELPSVQEDFGRSGEI
jgi:hypothetical protein